MNTEKALQNIGLSQDEAKIYKALSTLKKGSVLDISRESGVKRPTTYNVLDSLKKKGLVDKTTYRWVTDYKFLSPEHLKRYVRDQKKLIDKYLPEMEKLYNTEGFKLRFRVYEGKSAVKTLFEKSLRENEVMMIIGNKELFENHLRPYWDFYLKRSGQKNIRPKIKDLNGNTALLVWGNKVVFVSFSEKIQSFGFRNKFLADKYKEIWKNF